MIKEYISDKKKKEKKSFSSRGKKSADQQSFRDISLFTFLAHQKRGVLVGVSGDVG